MLNAAFFQHFGKLFALLNGNGAYQNWLAGFMVFNNIVYYRIEFCFFCFINNIMQVFADHRLVGRNFNDIQFIDFAEFIFLRHSGTSHTGKFIVKTEVILEGDGCQRFAFTSDFNALFCFNCLVQTLIVTAAVHQTSGELIHNDDFAVLYYIVHIACHDAAGLDSLCYIVLQVNVFRIRQVVHMEVVLCFFHAGRGESCGLSFFIYDIIRIFVKSIIILFIIQLCDFDLFQCLCETVSNRIHFRGFFTWAGNDQWCTRFIN